MATTGANYMAKSINFEKHDKIVKFDVNNVESIDIRFLFFIFFCLISIFNKIWDTAGQEKFRALTKIFYKDANVAILVYDITRKDSFKEIKEYWYNQVKENAAKKIGKHRFINLVFHINFFKMIS